MSSSSSTATLSTSQGACRVQPVPLTTGPTSGPSSRPTLPVKVARSPNSSERKPCPCPRSPNPTPSATSSTSARGVDTPASSPNFCGDIGTNVFDGAQGYYSPEGEGWKTCATSASSSVRARRSKPRRLARLMINAGEQVAGLSGAKEMAAAQTSNGPSSKSSTSWTSPPVRSRPHQGA